MAPRSAEDDTETHELSRRHPEESQRLQPSLEQAYRSSSSSEEDVDEYDPLNYDAGTLKRRKNRSKSMRAATTEERLGPSTAPKAWTRRRFCPSKFLCSLIALFIVTVLLLLATGGLWALHASTPPTGQSPPWYPSPLGGTAGDWAASYRKAAALVAQMTLPEKVNVTTGTGWAMGACVGNTGPVPRLGFPSICLQDGPLGLRFADNISAFPAGSPSARRGTASSCSAAAGRSAPRHGRKG